MPTGTGVGWPGVLHLVGSAVWMAQGVQLSLDSETPGDSGTAAGRGGTLIRPDTLELPPELVVVLQAPPVRVTKRTAADDRRTAELRLCGAALFSAGAGTVIVVPPLATDLAASAIGGLATRLRPKPRTGRPLLVTVEGLRRAVAEAGSDKLAAQDICIFMR